MLIWMLLVNFALANLKLEHRVTFTRHFHKFSGQIILEDDIMYSGTSVEKYNLMKPSKQRKSSTTIKRLRDYISTNGNHSPPVSLHMLLCSAVQSGG